jgi:hypothetical protein
VPATQTLAFLGKLRYNVDGGLAALGCWRYLQRSAAYVCSNACRAGQGSKSVQQHGLRQGECLTPHREVLDSPESGRMLKSSRQNEVCADAGLPE